MGSKRETMKIKVSDETLEAARKYRDKLEGKRKTVPEHYEENRINEEIIKINEEIYSIKSDLRYIDSILNSEIRTRRCDDSRHDEYRDKLYDLKFELYEYKEKFAQLQNNLFDIVLYLVSLFEAVKEMGIVPKSLVQIACDPGYRELLHNQACLHGVNLDEYVYQRAGDLHTDHDEAHSGEGAQED